MLRSVASAVVLGALTGAVHGQSTLYTQPLDPGGNLHKSAWYPPDGLDGDVYCWDSFTLPSAGTITEVRWMGGYTNFLSGAGLAPVFDFTVSIWPSIPAGIQPDILAGPVVEYDVGSNAGEAPAGISIPVTVPGGPSGLAPLYSYSFVLPEAFQAEANTRYWVQIVAWQGLTPQYHWPPDWGLPGATGGNGSHFRWFSDSGPYQTVSHDLAFTLLGTAPCAADVDGSGVLTLQDFVAFRNLYTAGDLAADFDTSGTLTLADFVAFRNAYVAGCP